MQLTLQERKCAILKKNITAAEKEKHTWYIIGNVAYRSILKKSTSRVTNVE